LEIWHKSLDVSTYCIDGNVYSPTWFFENLAGYACNDPNDRSCMNWGGCSQANAMAPLHATHKSLNGAGQTLTGGGTVFRSWCGVGEEEDEDGKDS